MTELNQEYERRGLMRPAAVMRHLAIEKDALLMLVAQRELSEVIFPWKGSTIARGYVAADVLGKRAIYRDGRVRLVPQPADGP